jgi:hypothetical protein
MGNGAVARRSAGLQSSVMAVRAAGHLEIPMPRYLVERTFPDGLSIPMNDDGRRVVAGVVATNADHAVTWVHSYVTTDRKQTYCIYDGPAPESIRKVAERNGLPIDRITEVSVLDPYFYRA